MRLGIDKPVPREEWNKYSCVRQFEVCRVTSGYGGGVVRARNARGQIEPPVKTFASLEDAEFFLQYEKTVNDSRYLAIFETLKITAERLI